MENQGGMTGKGRGSSGRESCKLGRKQFTARAEDGGRERVLSQGVNSPRGWQRCSVPRAYSTARGNHDSSAVARIGGEMGLFSRPFGFMEAD